jgi:hypothetical protein
MRKTSRYAALDFVSFPMLGISHNPALVDVVNIEENVITDGATKRSRLNGQNRRTFRAV